MNVWDVIVVGAGAAGLLAAARAAERGRRTLLIEKNRKPGVKILISGGTRCNLTHATDRRGIITAYGKQGKFLHSALAKLGPDELVALIEAEGVATKVEDTGKIFPVSDRAVDVVDALLARLRRSGAELAVEEPLASLTASTEPGGVFSLVTAQRTLTAPKVIVCVGGKSYPGCGTTGDGYGWLAALGHTIVTPRPALVPITTDVAWVRELQGVTLPDVSLRLVDTADGRALDTRRGSLLFAHFGLTGPAPLDISREVSGHAEPRRLALECNFWPAVNPQQCLDHFRDHAAAGGKKQLLALFPEVIPRRLAEALCKLAAVAGDVTAAQLAKADRNRVAQVVQRAVIQPSGTRGYAKAEVTAGGVSLDEVDSRTMESKRVPGLYLAGEVLDLDGPIGGFNFQAAFSTGWLAGESV